MKNSSVKIIWILAWKYMKRNKHRTILTILGIALSVAALTFVVLFSSAFRNAEEGKIIEKEGGWHARFHQVTEKQIQEIATWNKTKQIAVTSNCEEHAGNCVDVELKHPGVSAIGRTQRFAEKINMSILPEEEQYEDIGHEKIKYNITYHYSLLELYGIFYEGAQGSGALTLTMIVIIIIFSSVFIYNVFAISVSEKIRYLGMLGSVGATRWQKANCIFFEGIIEGMSGIFLGLIQGIFIEKQVLSRKSDMEFIINRIDIGMILLCGLLIVSLASMIPASRAGNASIMDMVIRRYPSKLEGQKLTTLKKQHRILGTEGAIALKNVFFHEKQYTICIAMLSLICCIMVWACFGMQWRREYTKITGVQLDGEPLRLVFQCGMLIALTAFCMTSMIQKIAADIRMRRREFAVYQSLGMGKRQLAKMMVIENSIYGIATGIIGIPFSIFLLHEQYKEIAIGGVYVKTAQDAWVVKFQLSMPYQIVVAEILLVLVVVLLPTLYGLTKMKRLDMQYICNEND